ncbi:hypothetical protein MY3296_005451 [Beauveria thailandica]
MTAEERRSIAANSANNGCRRSTFDVALRIALVRRAIDGPIVVVPRTVDPHSPVKLRLLQNLRYLSMYDPIVDVWLRK